MDFDPDTHEDSGCSIDMDGAISMGIAFSAVLTAGMSIFKSTGFLDCPWWAVTAPVWIPLVSYVGGWGLVALLCAWLRSRFP